MEKKNQQTISVVALVISILPLMTFIPVILQITLPDGLRTVWAGANMICVLLLMLLGIVALALFLNLVS